MKLDVVFIHSNSAIQVYQALAKQHSAIEPPIWLGMLASSCRSAGYSVAAIDCECEQLSPLQCSERVGYLKPKLVVFVVYGQQPSASSQNMDGAIGYALQLKLHHPDIPIMFVGGYVAALPNEALAHKCIDFICQNEGVYTIRDLLSISDLTNTSELRKVQGLGWKEDDHQVLNEIGNIVPNDLLEQDLPGVAWDLLPPLTSYRTAGWHSWPNGSIKSPFAALYTSLGCPFFCHFCKINIINRTKHGADISAADSAVFRYWSPQFTIKQFDYFASKGVKNIKIADELFVLREQHFLELCKLLAERKYGFNIWCYARVDTCRERWLDTLKQSGVNFIGLGVESPDQTVRRDMVKGGFKDIKINEVINQVHNAGIAVGANYIVGSRTDTAESIKHNLDFAMSHKTENYNIYAMMAYPGSPLHLEAKKRGWQLPDRYAGYSQHSYWTQNLPTETLSAAEVLRARDKAWDQYFSDQSYHELLKSRFGQAAVDSVKSMLGIKLKRRLFGDPEPI